MLVLLLFAISSQISNKSPVLRPAGILAGIAAYGGATYASFISSRSVKQSGSKRFWTYWAGGIMLWAIASAIEGVAQTLLSVRFMKPSIADWLWISGSLSLALAFANYQISKEKIFGRIRIILDLLLMVIGMGVLFWLILLRPVLMIGLADVIRAFWEQSRAVFDLIVVTIMLRMILLLSPGEDRRSFFILGIGILIQSLADIVNGYQGLEGSEFPSVWVQAGWITVGMCVIFAAQMTLTKGAAPFEKKKDFERSLVQRLEPVFPLVMMYIVLGFVIVDWLLSQRIEPVTIWSLVLMGALLILRQGVIAGQSELRKYAELVHSAGDLAFIFDSHGDIQLANPSLREAIRIEEQDESLPNFAEIIKTTRIQPDQIIQAAHDGWAGEVEFLRKDGHYFPVHLSVKLLTEEKRKDKLYAATAHDLTEIRVREDELRKTLDQLAKAQEDLKDLNKQLEAKVEARTKELEQMVNHLAELNEELKTLDRMKSEFVALVSHELRAPLTTILTGLEVVLRGYAEMGGNPRSSLELIKKEADRLSGFIETILDLSALEAGRFPLQLQSISLSEVLEDVSSRFSPDQGYGRIRVSIPKGLASIRADKQVFHSVLYHLLDNALKYAPDGEIFLKAKETGTNVDILVVDAGPGIPENERERVFEMFYRLDTSDSRRVYGRGLGLHLVHRFLEAMDGGIALQSADSGGTQVRIWLPKAQEDAR